HRHSGQRGLPLGVHARRTIRLRRRLRRAHLRRPFADVAHSHASRRTAKSGVVNRARLVRLAESVTAEIVVLAAVAAALYPVLWVVSTALSPRELAAKPSAIPWPTEPSLD